MGGKVGRTLNGARHRFSRSQKPAVNGRPNTAAREAPWEWGWGHLLHATALGRNGTEAVPYSFRLRLESAAINWGRREAARMLGCPVGRG